jgi:hypothetical protein
MDTFRHIRQGFVLLCAGWLLSTAALAEETDQFWPEVCAFVTLSPRTRLFFDLPVSKGMEGEEVTVELAAHVDISLVPVVRKSLRSKDWARNRYLWVRMGYDHLTDVSNGVKTSAEDRLILELRARAELPAEIWIEGRARADLRWIGGDFSTRYRARLEMSREFLVRDHAVTPYINAEWFYDTRYDGWSKHLIQAGTEVTATKHFRYEVYVARQVDHLPSDSATNALGIFFKWYF